MKPAKIKKDITKRDSTKYSAFHHDIEHNTERSDRSSDQKSKATKYRENGHNRPEEEEEKHENAYNKIAIIAGGPHLGVILVEHRKITSCGDVLFRTSTE